MIKKGGTGPENVMSPGVDGGGGGSDSEQFDRHIMWIGYNAPWHGGKLYGGW